MNLKSLLGANDFFAIDIGTTAVRVVQLKGSSKNKKLVRYGSAPIDVKIAESESEADRKRLADTIINLVKQSGITTKDVVTGIPSNRMFATVVDFPRLPADEFRKAVTYQLDTHIPMPIEESKVDWAVVGDSPNSKDHVEVLIAAVSNNFAESRMDMLEAIGLNVIALEPDALALVRALLPRESTGTYMILDIGDKATDLVITYGGNPRLIRSIPIGGSAFVKAAKQNLNVDDAQANQFVYKFGLNADKLEGQVFRAIEPTVDNLVSEAAKSIKFFANRYKGVNVEKIVVSGGASTLPGFPLYLANKLGIQVEIGNAWLNVSYPQSKHNELIALSNHFAVAVGLAERD